MNPSDDRLYNLLPAIHRLRDAVRGGPLQALLAVISEQVQVLEEDLSQFYDDQFIETCADWVVPYIGDLVGYRALYGTPSSGNASTQVGNPRAEVANTIGYRRRKGTVVALEQLARDVTGWPASVVEYFRLLATTQFLNHLRPDNLQCPDLRRVGRLLAIGTAFEQVTHSLDVRRIAPDDPAAGRGRYNIPNIGIFLWRIEAFRIFEGTPRAVIDGCYTFDPLGRDVPLFNPTRTPDQPFTRTSGLSEVPHALGRRELASKRPAGLPTVQALYFDRNPPAFQVLLAGGPGAPGVAIPPAQVRVCDLSTLARPPAASFPVGPGDPPVRVVVDPELGRLAFVAGDPPAETEVRVLYHFGLPGDLGGGEYERPRGPETPGATRHTVVRGDDLSALPGGFDVYLIDNSSTFKQNITFSPAPGQSITLRALDLCRPVVDGTITIHAADGASVTLDGLWVSGPLTVADSRKPPTTPGAPAALPFRVSLLDCTISPWTQISGGLPKLPSPSITWTGVMPGDLVMARCIVGRVNVPEEVTLRVIDGVIDGLAPNALAIASTDAGGPSGPITVKRSTIVGTTHAREVTLAENSIFTGTLTSDRRQSGCVRFCSLTPDSTTPRRYFCQPDRAIDIALAASGSSDPAVLAAITDEVGSRVRPAFTDTLYTRPAYLQLDAACPVEIRTGSDEESEIGVYSRLYAPRREANLRLRLDEYLRFGLEAGVIDAT